jgi:hypothetical protein
LGETAATLASSVVAEPIAGLSGIVQSINPFAEKGAGARAVEGVRESLTYAPKTTEGQQNIQSIGEVLQPVSEAIQSAESGIGDVVFEKTGSPTLAAASTTIPTLAMELTGLGIAKKGKQIAKTVPDAEKVEVIKTAKGLDIPVLTTDLYAPTSKVGKLFQDLSESLGPFGSGGQRIKQQKSRQEAVSGLADEMEIELDSDFFTGMVKSLNKRNKQALKDAGEVRGRVVESLNQFGDVPATKTLQAINDLELKQAQLRETANPTITKLLDNYKKSFSQGSTFEQMKDFRTQVIKARNAFDKSEDTSPRDTAQAIKSAIDKDMMAFARKHDRQAAKDWLASNRKFAEESDLTKRTELKRILDTGETTPEQIGYILSRGRLSELNRLHKSLTPEGRINAQKALIQKALQDSKYFDVDKSPNPDVFTNVLNKPNFQKAKNVFFEGANKDRIDGLNRVLNATRRAQEATTSVRTGEKVVLPLVGAIGGTGIVVNPLVGIPSTIAVSAIAKAYESRAFRNALLKLSGTKPQSRQELQLLEGIMTTLVAEVAAAKSQQEQE